MYKKLITIKFRESDPAGILFFSRVFELAHDTYEEMLQSQEIPWGKWFNNKDWAVPIKHSEAQFHSPLYAGEEYEIKAAVSHKGNSSFSTLYQFLRNGEIAAEIKLIHVFLDKKTNSKMSLPPEVSEKLGRLMTHSP